MSETTAIMQLQAAEAEAKLSLASRLDATHAEVAAFKERVIHTLGADDVSAINAVDTDIAAAVAELRQAAGAHYAASQPTPTPTPEPVAAAPEPPVVEEHDEHRSRRGGHRDA